MIECLVSLTICKSSVLKLQLHLRVQNKSNMYLIVCKRNMRLSKVGCL